MKTVATFAGTGTNIVKTILGQFGVDLIIIDRHTQLENLKFDGVILLGGTDIDTSIYGEENLYSSTPHTKRDIIELELIAMALEQHLPIMGICRGMQMLTAVFGGSLYQDIWWDGATDYHPRSHKVEFSGRLAGMVPVKHVNSLHHQAVKEVPAGFKVVARAHDGIVEGIWKPGILGVQFHPELMFAHDTRWINLFRWFIGGLV